MLYEQVGNSFHPGLTAGLARCGPDSRLRNPLVTPLNLDPLGVNPKIEEQFDEAAGAAERSFRPAIYPNPDADLADWSVHD